MTATTKRIGIVAASVVARHPNVCPNCKGTSIRQEGFWRRGFTREIVNGEEKPLEASPVFSEGLAAIECDPCNMRFEIHPDTYVRAEQEKWERTVRDAIGEGRSALPDKPILQ